MPHIQPGQVTLPQHDYVLTASGTKFGVSGIAGAIPPALPEGDIKIGNTIHKIRQEILPLTVRFDNYELEILRINSSTVDFELKKYKYDEEWREGELKDALTIPILNEIELYQNQPVQAFPNISFRFEDVKIRPHRFKLFVNDFLLKPSPTEEYFKTGDEGQVGNYRFLIMKDNFKDGQQPGDSKINITCTMLEIKNYVEQ